MNGPVRLLESSQNPAARQLLQAGVVERPRAAALQSTAVALGIATSALAASPAAAASAGAAAEVTASSLATPSLVVVAAKWLVMGSVGGLALAGGASLAFDPGTEREVTAAVPRATVEPERASAPVAEPSTAPASRASAAARSEPKRTRPAVSTPPITGEVASAPKRHAGATAPAIPASGRLPDGQSLAKEIAMIDGARRSLSAGDAATTLRHLDEYAAAVRTGTLDREAQLLRIDALAQSGQRAAALLLAERYLKSYPNDPHAARLRALSSSP